MESNNSLESIMAIGARLFLETRALPNEHSNDLQFQIWSDEFRAEGIVIIVPRERRAWNTERLGLLGGSIIV